MDERTTAALPIRVVIAQLHWYATEHGDPGGFLARQIDRLLAIEREAAEAARAEVAEPGDGWCVECGETWPCRGVRAPTKADRAIPHRMAAETNRG